jgi:hypothetical protein
MAIRQENRKGYIARGPHCGVGSCLSSVCAKGLCNAHYKRLRAYGDVNVVHPKCGLPKHGGSRSVEYRIWNLMKQRCSNPKKQSYQNYGGRGVTVCERWNDFANFLADMGARPSGNHSIDRIDNDRGYEPDNCRWATPEQQHRNRRDNVFIEFQGVTRCASEWAYLYGLTRSALNGRLRRGWSMKHALNEPPRRTTLK